MIGNIESGNFGNIKNIIPNKILAKIESKFWLLVTIFLFSKKLINLDNPYIKNMLAIKCTTFVYMSMLKIITIIPKIIIPIPEIKLLNKFMKYNDGNKIIYVF